MRLHLRLWHEVGPRHFPRLRSLLLTHTPSAGLALRLARAGCLHEVATANGDKATQLLSAIQVRLLTNLSA